MTQPLPPTTTTKPNNPVDSDAVLAGRSGAYAISGLTVVKPAWLMPLLIVVLVGFIVFQQVQIAQLNQSMANLGDSLKSNDVKSRLASQEESLGALNQRLVYLDSKIDATNRTAQEALTRIKAHEDKDVIGKWVDGLKQTFGLH